ncbi:CoA transferase, partial [Stenotrophomonas maltophilia]|uniref:CoA transferase n=1 Tax=Stenotrophomonas maltophilia TaxID=40324 RepID=UPI001954699A
FRTRDGQIAIAPSDNTFFGRLMDALDLWALQPDADFADNQLRVRHRARLNAVCDGKLSEQDSAHCIALLNAAGVPCGPVY